MSDHGSEDNGAPGRGPDPSDRELAATLSMALAAEVVPPEVVVAAQEAFTWRTIDAELDELVDLAVLSAGFELAGVRGSEGDRSLSFEYDEVVIDLEVRAAGAERELTGQIVPSEATTIELQRPNGPAERIEADGLGRFRWARVAAGPIRLLCRFGPATQRPMLLTEWVVI